MNGTVWLYICMYLYHTWNDYLYLHIPTNKLHYRKMLYYNNKNGNLQNRHHDFFRSLVEIFLLLSQKSSWIILNVLDVIRSFFATSLKQNLKSGFILHPLKTHGLFKRKIHTDLKQQSFRLKNQTEPLLISFFVKRYIINNIT